MITIIEKALSNRSKCTVCGKTIEVGSLRGVEDRMAFGHMSHVYFDAKCTEFVLREQIVNSQKLLDQLIV